MDESEEQVRQVQKAVRDLDTDADHMEEHTGELDAQIDSVRQEFERRRNDENVPGLPPEPDRLKEQSDAVSGASQETPGEGDDGEGDDDDGGQEQPSQE